MLISDLDTFITIPVSDKPHYTSNINILGQPLKLICGYNSRNKSRWLVVTDLNNRPLLTQTFLRQNKISVFNFTANRLGLSYTVTLRPKSKDVVIPDSYDYLNWSNDFDLYFLGRLQSTEDKFEVNRRLVYVGK